MPQITEGALQLVMALVQGIIDNLPALVEAAVQMIVTLAAGIEDALPELIPAVVEAVILICETLINNMDQILDAAFAIIEGLAQGLLNALPKLIEALPRIIASIIDFVTSVFEGIGGNMAIGLGEGFDKAMARVADDMQNAVPTDFNISPDINISGRGGSGGLASGPLVVVQQMIVRSEDDIRRISQELYNLMQTGSSAQGRFSFA